jgi:ABC-type antimicrobial peptide transport system permease subunit
MNPGEHRIPAVKRIGVMAGALLTGLTTAAFFWIYWLRYFPEGAATYELRTFIGLWTVFSFVAAGLARFLANRWSKLSALLGAVGMIAFVALIALPQDGYEMAIERLLVASFIPPILLGLCLGALRRSQAAKPNPA